MGIGAIVRSHYAGEFEMVGHDGNENVARPALSGDPTLRHVLQTAAAIRGLGCAFAVTMSMFSLSGCMTATKETAQAASTADAALPEAAAGQAPDGSYEDQQVVAVGGSPQQQAGAEANVMVPAATGGQPTSLTMHSTGLNATSSSIFSVQTPAALPVQAQNAEIQDGNAPLPTDQATGVNPTSNSLFNSGQPPADATSLPLEGASNGNVAAQAVQVASADVGTGGAALPAAVPVPSSGDIIRNSGVPQPDATQTAPADLAAVAVPPLSDSGSSQTDTDTPNAAEEPLTFAALFAAKRKNRNAFNGDRFAKAPPKRTLAVAKMQPPQIAALGFTDLPGVRTTSMFATVDDSQPGHDDDSAAIEMAALPGLARLAPSGLWLQTERVETGCFQPELLQVLKVVETHYGRKVMVTSGLRDVKHNRRAGGRRNSLHTTCEAADIQVPGVTKWDLANYLRTIPGRGGVGTYCHTESVHIDTGEARDWNWRCRRRRT